MASYVGKLRRRDVVRLMVASVTVPWLQCAATAMTFGFSVGALAQDDTVSFLEEIIVTARRHEENLQTVPLSVIAFPEK